MQALYQPARNAQVHVFDMSQSAWQVTGNPGLHLKPVRIDDLQGSFLGLVKFEAFARSGLHQHQGLATSFVIDGGLTDYHGSIKLHEAGLNFKGATHDAVAYQNTLLVSRLEAPVSYPPNSDISGVHAGSEYRSFQNPDPSIPPEINVAVDLLQAQPSGYDGIECQVIYDYAGQPAQSRYVQLSIRPHTQVEFEAGGVTEFWVRGGQLKVNGLDAFANCFIVCEPQAKVTIDCPFGALLLAWAEAPEKNRHASKSLFGF
jgi:hypothetical protein